MHVGLIPLDERPVNTRYPQMIAAIAGATVHLPPPSLLSRHRRPADCAALRVWLDDAAPALDGLIVSCETLGYGSLIASRTSDEPASVVLERLDALRELKARRPGLPILGFNVVTRVSNADGAVEEPAYWAEFGTRLYRLSQLMDRYRRGEATGVELETVKAGVPAPHRRDFLRRRARNHTVNLGVLQLLAAGVLDLLVLSSDDTSPYGLPSREKGWLAEWGEQLELGERLLMYPGADEVGCVLLARLLNSRSSAAPRFKPLYEPVEGAQRVAPYEDGPVDITVQRQVHAAGGMVTTGEADFLLAVHAPTARRGEWDAGLAEEERAERLPALMALIASIAGAQAQGQRVAVADVAYPNGADPALVELLQATSDVQSLAAYGGWNTAGNTIGTVVAQACASLLINAPDRQAAQARFLAHRLVEDWGYQRVVRDEVRDWLGQTTGQTEPDAGKLAATEQRIEARLNELIGELRGLGGRYHIAPGSVRLPWDRLFEVDFELVDGGR